LPSITAMTSSLVCNGTTGPSVPTPDTSSRAGYKIYTFTSGTGTVTW
jgi:hypothetical protein